MDRRQLAHILRAAADVTKEKEMVVIGSQAILGSFANPPSALLVSMEVDIYPLHHPELADYIDGALGEGSQFNDTFGYYAHGVGPDTAILPAGWQDRLVRFEPRGANGAIGWCLEAHDLVLSKAVRMSPKDLRYLEVALGNSIVSPDGLLERLATMPIDPQIRSTVAARIGAEAGGSEATS